MTRKTLVKGVPVLLVLALILSLSTAAWARPFGRGHHRMNLTPEQAGKLFDLKQKFMNETANLRKAMVVNRAELRALWKAENPDAKQIVAKQKELNSVREQLQEKMVAFRIQARKICPQMGKGRGFGMGSGWGHGRGMAMAGNGPGFGMGPGCGF